MSFSEQTKIANDFGKHDVLSTYNCAVLTISWCSLWITAKNLVRRKQSAINFQLIKYDWFKYFSGAKELSSN